MTMTMKFSIYSFLLLAACSACDAQEQPATEVGDRANGRRHTEIGIAAGTPSGVNLVLGQWFDRWGVRASGMNYGAGLRGIQVYAGVEFWRDPDHRHSAGLVGGAWHSTNTDWKFLGPAYDLHIGGFFMEFGIGWGKCTYMANQVIWQFGYSYSLFEK